MECKTTRFEVLGDPTRMQILNSLSGGKSLRAKDILANLPISQPTLSHHMHVLDQEKLVVSRKVGRECFYSIDEATINNLMTDLQALLPEKPDKEKKEKKKKKE
ncbi:MAG: helix-turn-helix transcriptional regulator, partial [Clostridiales bacterium]|nr:helix-turn-helix transcriptional regulator [Clostridiales bacterium]